MINIGGKHYGRNGFRYSIITGDGFFKSSHKKVKVYEDNGTITLTPFYEEKPRFDHLIGIFSDGKMSVDKFLEKKRQEMELEL